MSHIRKQVRDAVSAALTAAGLSVSASRAWPVQREQLPLVLVYVREEELEPVDMGGGDRALRRRMSVHIEALAEASETVDDDLDALGVQIERALAMDRTLGGVTHDLVPESASLSMDADGERVFGALRMEYIAAACTAMNEPEVAK